MWEPAHAAELPYGKISPFIMFINRTKLIPTSKKGSTVLAKY